MTVRKLLVAMAMMMVGNTIAASAALVGGSCAQNIPAGQVFSVFHDASVPVSSFGTVLTYIDLPPCGLFTISAKTSVAVEESRPAPTELSSSVVCSLYNNGTNDSVWVGGSFDEGLNLVRRRSIVNLQPDINDWYLAPTNPADYGDLPFTMPTWNDYFRKSILSPVALNIVTTQFTGRVYLACRNDMGNSVSASFSKITAVSVSAVSNVAN